MYDANNTSPTALVQLTTSNGDLEHVTLRRRGTVYEGSILSANDAYVAHRDESLDIVPSDFISAYYVDANTGSGQPQLIQTTVPVQPEYTFTPQRTATVDRIGHGAPLSSPFRREPGHSWTMRKSIYRSNFDFSTAPTARCTSAQTA